MMTIFHLQLMNTSHLILYYIKPIKSIIENPYSSLLNMAVNRKEYQQKKKGFNQIFAFYLHFGIKHELHSIKELLGSNKVFGMPSWGGWTHSEGFKPHRWSLWGRGLHTQVAEQ